MPGKFLFALLFFIPTSFNVYAKDSGAKPAQQVFTLIYNQQFDRASQVLAAKKDSLGNFYSGILALDLAWWKYISRNNRDDLDQFARIAGEYRSSGDNSADGKIKRLIGLNYSLRYEIMQANFFKAGILHLKIKSQLRETGRLVAENNPGPAKLFELYRNLFYYFEKRYLPFSGTPKSEALAVLESYSSDEDLIVNSLANYFIGKIYLEVERQPGKALNYFEILSARFPGNEIFKGLTQSCSQKSQSHKP